MWNVVGDFLRGYLGLIRVAENINEIFELTFKYMFCSRFDGCWRDASYQQRYFCITNSLLRKIVQIFWFLLEFLE